MKTIEEVKALLGALPAGGLPIALLPVGVQTRFVVRDGVNQLLVRVYPDELHLDSHKPALTAAEIEWGRRYWELIWPAARDTAALRRAWDALAERFGTRRAGWVARRLTPTNLAARPGTPPVFGDPGPPRIEDVSPIAVRALPDRWVVMGYQDGTRVLLEAGAPIPEKLEVGFGADAPEPAAGELPIDPRMRWMVDFEAAEAVGMGIRIALKAPVALDRLLVLGVKAGLAPEPSTARLEALLDAHHYTRGLALPAPGTPTNNSAETPSGYSRRDGGGFEVEVAPPRITTGSDGAELTRLLGVKRDLLTNVEGAARTEDLAAKRLQAALWPATGGYYLDQMLQTEQPLARTEVDAAKRFFVDFVRAQGPFPAVRIGRQPYGLVPAMSLELLAGDTRFVRTLKGLRAVWRNALAGVPRLQPDVDDEQTLVEILRMQPFAVGHRARAAVDAQTFTPGAVLPGELAQDLRFHAAILKRRLTAFGIEGSTERLFSALPATSTRLLNAPLVSSLAGLRTATFDNLLGAAPQSLLQALVRHSLVVAQASAAYRKLLGAQPYREPVLVDIVGEMTPAPTETLLRVLDRDPALRASIHTAPELEEQRAALQFLESVPAEGLARHLSGCLDLFAYRLDAWITALATRRLNELRKATPRGLALGGFGWVEDLRPEPRAPVRVLPTGEEGPLSHPREPGGAIHAPSMPHASAAAVLRSGYLNETSPAFAVDLRSERVRLAQSLLDGIRQGQALSELLGYRFERALHERGLDRFLLGFRRISRLPELSRAQERLAFVWAMGGINQFQFIMEAEAAIAARLVVDRERLGAPATATAEDLARRVESSVVDGLVLARLFRANQLPLTQLGFPVGAPAPAPLTEELRALDAAIDALGDALTAEGVYQAVRGNPARAAASVDALAQGDVQPPELEVVQTPRAGASVTHRLVTLFCNTPVPAPLTGVRGARAIAEPAIELWLRQMLGDLRQVIYAAEFADASGRVLLRRDKQTLGALIPSPLDALYMSTTDLTRLLEYALRKGAPATIPADATLRLLPDRTAALPATQLSLTEFLEILRTFREAVLGARAIGAGDLALPGSEVAPAADAAELQGRADVAAATLRRARAGLAAPDDVRERLADFLWFGFPDAVPLADVAAQVTAVLAEADRRLAAVDAMTLDRAAAAPEEQVRFDQERLRIVFGAAFRALPLVRPANLVELGSSLRRSDELQGGDPLQALSWLQGAGRVRPGASRLGHALSYAAALERAPAKELKVAQLPFAAGERWIGLAGATPPSGKVSLVVHLPRPFQTTAPLSGLLLDEWVEVVPDDEVTTGVAFNYEAPGARAPQSVLLAVAPPGTARWEVETLEATLLETLELAKLRAVDPQALRDDPLLHRALPALYLTTNLAGDTISTDFGALA